MAEVKCPNCGAVFQIDESYYEQIASQVRTAEFRNELERMEREMKEAHAKELEIQKLQNEQKGKEELEKKDKALSAKELEIAELRMKLESKDQEAALKNREMLGEKDKVLNAKELEIAELRMQLEAKDAAAKLSENAIKESYEIKLRDQEELIEHYKDLKARLSTKMLGETLEQHCMNEFNSIRAAAFPNAYFEKDNDARTGSKGDFIFRESEAGVEYISIMFEMKNEADETASKHKNEDFFKELDKDRREKGCEYAVLVSLLESDSDYYNNGIVDVSHRYPKMFVVRPQFFIPIISLLRNAARESLAYRKEVALIKNQQIDVRNFEQNMNDFKDAFSRNYRIASDKFKAAVDEIDKSIAHLQKIKDNLLSSENQLRLANSKAEDLSIRRLTKNAPSVKALFDDSDPT